LPAVLHFRWLSLLVVLLFSALLAVPFVAGWLSSPLAALIGTGPGWKRFQTQDFSLNLPAAYTGGDTTGADLDQVVSTLKDMGGDDNTSLADAIQAGRSQFAFWAFDLDSLGGSRFPTGVSISRETVIVDADITIEDLAGAMAQRLPSQFQLQDSTPVQLGSLQAQRLEILTHALNVDVEQALYVVRQGHTIWKITFATPASDFDTRLASFEQSMRSLALNPPS
jgi:hypothetical protein